MAWLVHTESEDYRFTDTTESLGTDEAREFLTREAAAAFLRRIKRSTQGMAALRRLASDRHPDGNISGWNDDEVIEFIASELVDRHLTLTGGPTGIPRRGRGGEPGEPEQPETPGGEEPSEYECGNTQWIDTSKYCGDNARLECTITGGPPDGSATVEILHPSDGSVVDTINANLTGGRVEATWVAKAQTADWRTDQIRFRVRAAGLTCTSSNTFTFRARPTTGTVNQDYMRGCPGGSNQHRTVYDFKLEESRVLQTLKLKAEAESGTSGATVTSFKTEAETRIESVWNDGFNNKKFHRHDCQRGESCDCEFDCCKAGFHLNVQFVTSGQHRRIIVVGQPNPSSPTVGSWTRYDDSTWAYPAKAQASTYAHEGGHMLGQYDEYVTSCNDPTPSGDQYHQPAPPPASERNLMSTSGNTRLLNRHYRRVLAFLNDNADGDEYDIIPAGP